MDESNWWLYLIGAIAAYVLIPWRAVFKWLAVAFFAAMAFTLSTDAGHPPVYRLMGGAFFGLMAILTARSEYRDSDSGGSGKKTGTKMPQPYRVRCYHCMGTGKVRCLHWLANDRDSRGYSCYECQGTHFKKCVFCNGTGNG